MGKITSYYIHKTYSRKSHIVRCRTQCVLANERPRTTLFTREKSRSSNHKLRMTIFHFLNDKCISMYILYRRHQKVVCTFYIRSLFRIIKLTRLAHSFYVTSQLLNINRTRALTTWSIISVYSSTTIKALSSGSRRASYVVYGVGTWTSNVLAHFASITNRYQVTRQPRSGVSYFKSPCEADGHSGGDYPWCKRLPNAYRMYENELIWSPEQ